MPLASCHPRRTAQPVSCKRVRPTLPFDCLCVICALAGCTFGCHLVHWIQARAILEVVRPLAKMSLIKEMTFSVLRPQLEVMCKTGGEWVGELAAGH